jgi:hypothetical protein
MKLNATTKIVHFESERFFEFASIMISFITLLLSNWKIIPTCGIGPIKYVLF